MFFARSESIHWERLDKMESVLAENLRKYREAKGYRSREAFSEAADIPFPTYRSIEAGKSWPEKSNVEKIARALGVAEWELFRHPSTEALPAKVELLRLVAALDDDEAEALLPQFDGLLSALREHGSAADLKQDADESGHQLRGRVNKPK